MSSCLPCVVVVPVFIPWDTRATKSLEHKSSPNTHTYHTHERERAVIRKESIQVTKLSVTRCNTPRRQTLSPQSLPSQPAPYRHGHVSHLTAKWILWSPIYHLVKLWPPKTPEFTEPLSTQNTSYKPGPTQRQLWALSSTLLPRHALIRHVHEEVQPEILIPGVTNPAPKPGTRSQLQRCFSINSLGSSSPLL